MTGSRLTRRDIAVTVAAPAAASAVGLVAAALTTEPVSVAWAIGTVVVAGLLALRLRGAGPAALGVAMCTVAVVVLAVGLPTLATRGGPERESGGRGAAAGHPAPERPAADLDAELRAALDRAEEILPGGSNSLLGIDLDDSSTRVTVLDLRTGQRISSSTSIISRQWQAPTIQATNDRQDAVFTRGDIAGLDLTATAARVTAAADAIGVDRRSKHASDGIEISRRSGDKHLIVEFSMSGEEIETDAAGKLPENLELARIDGFLPVAERLLRANGIDPAQPVLGEVGYRVYAPNTSSVGPSEEGTIAITVDGGGRYGTITQTVGKFPEVRLRPGRGSSGAFPLSVVNAAALERMRADVERRFSVLPVDAHAASLKVERDRSRAADRTPPQRVQFGLGPNYGNRAYYRPDGTYLAPGT